MPEAESLESRWQTLQAEIHNACTASGRDSREVRLLAVSKGQPASAIKSIYALGQREFGENYAQEMAAKANDLTHLSGIKFVYIGKIQSNKIASIARVASEIQSVGSVRHATMLEKAIHELRKAPFPIFLLVNAGDEATKHGFLLNELEASAREITTLCPSLQIQGIMAIPPMLSEAEQDKLYSKLKSIAKGIGLGKLSLGMSSDLNVAIRHGSHCIRVGTRLFGARATR